MASSRQIQDVLQLVRARRLLAATLDDSRAIVGRVSREWIRSEVETRVRVRDLPPRLRRRAEAQISSQAVAGEDPAPDAVINSNRLPKLEPAINAHILVGLILYGARLYGAGTPDPTRGVCFSEIENDLIIASMIHATLGLADQHSALLPDRYRIVDEAYLSAEFGPALLGHIHAIRAHASRFAEALADETTEKLRIPVPYANALAAIETSRLRLTARTAGDEIFSILDDDKRQELRDRGIEAGEPDDVFAERPYLEADYRSARAAVALPGVERSTVREPIADQLLRSVENVLRCGVPTAHLVGRYGTVRNFHNALPMMERFSPINRRTVEDPCGGPVDVEGPYALGTLHVTGLEVTRYLHNARRKGNGTGAGHSFTIAATAERLLGPYINVPVIAGSDCHDVVEDGGVDVLGYDQSLELFAARLGSPLAALVAEVTDSITKSDGPAKAAAFLHSRRIRSPEHLYNVGQLEQLRAVATDPETPYTLAGVLMKVVDTGITQDEGIRDPDMMTGVWKHSGARVSWAQYSKGEILRPLLKRLAIEIRLSEVDPFYHERDGALSASLIDRLRQVVGWSFLLADHYAAQNLTILADEYRLDDDGRDELIALFLEDDGARSEAEAVLVRLLDDERLDPEVRRRGLPATFRVDSDGSVTRKLDKLLDYRESASWRRTTRDELRLSPVSREVLDEVAELYRLRMGSE